MGNQIFTCKSFNRKKLKSIIRKEIVSPQSSDQTHLDIRNRTVGLRQQIQCLNHTEISIKNPQNHSKYPLILYQITHRHTDLNIPYASEFINVRINKHINKPESSRFRWSSGQQAGLWYPSSRVQTRPKSLEFFGQSQKSSACLPSEGK